MSIPRQRRPGQIGGKGHLGSRMARARFDAFGRGGKSKGCALWLFAALALPALIAFAVSRVA